MRMEEMKGDDEIEGVENDRNKLEDGSSPEKNNTISSEDDKHTNIDDNVNINKIVAIMSIKEPETLTKIFNLMKTNNCLNYYPLLTPYHNIEKLVDMLLEENYEYENT
ncbi:Leu/Phe-tRNA protein transferase, putative, partial [Plasmodium ovale curtisi]